MRFELGHTLRVHADIHDFSDDPTLESFSIPYAHTYTTPLSLGETCSSNNQTCVFSGYVVATEVEASKYHGA